MIVGSGEVADKLAERVNAHPELGLEPIGYIDDIDGDQPLRAAAPRRPSVLAS